MKKTFKLIAAALAAVTAMSCTAVSANADKLRTVDGVKYRYSDSGEKKGTYTGWTKTSSGKRFYYKKGVAQTGWVHIGKNWYYIDKSKGRLTGKQTIGGALYNLGKGGSWDKKCTYPDGTAEYPPDKLWSVLSKKAYGGLVYEDGMYVVMSVDGKAEKAVQKALPGLSGIIFRPVKYSIYELEKIRTKLADELKGKWYGHGINDAENKIVFEVDEEYLDEVTKYINDNGYSDYARAETGSEPTLD